MGYVDLAYPAIILSALFAAVTWPGIYAVKLLPWSPFGHDLTLGNVLTDVVVVNNCVSVVYYVFAIVHKLEMSKKIFATLQIMAYFAFIKIEWMFFKASEGWSRDLCSCRGCILLSLGRLPDDHRRLLYHPDPSAAGVGLTARF